MKIDGHEMPPDYKYGAALLGDENEAILLSGKPVVLNVDKRNRPYEMGELLQVPTTDGGNVWAKVISVKEGIADGDPVWQTEIQMVGD